MIQQTEPAKNNRRLLTDEIELISSAVFLVQPSNPGISLQYCDIAYRNFIAAISHSAKGGGESVTIERLAGNQRISKIISHRSESILLLLQGSIEDHPSPNLSFTAIAISWSEPR
jgi:hypothetical protein